MSESSEAVDNVISIDDIKPLMELLRESVPNNYVSEWQCGATRLGVDGVVSVLVKDGSSEVIIKRASGTQKLRICVNDDLDVKKLFPVFSSKTGSSVADLRSNRTQ